MCANMKKRKINYIMWAEEYEHDAQRLLVRINDIKEKSSTGIPPEEKYDLDERAGRLRNIYHELRLTAKHLRERGEKYNA